MAEAAENPAGNISQDAREAYRQSARCMEVQALMETDEGRARLAFRAAEDIRKLGGLVSPFDFFGGREYILLDGKPTLLEGGRADG